MDYPIFSSVPETDFSCRGTVGGEYYADVGTSCQVFHVCTALSEGLAQRFSFLCPNGNLTLDYLLSPLSIISAHHSALGTMFHQQLKICHWWFYVDCGSSQQFYNLDPELTRENFARADDIERDGERDRERERADFQDDQPPRYGDNLSDLDYRPRARARRGRPLWSGEQRARGHNRRVRQEAAPVSRRRIGSGATIIRDNGGNRQRRIPRRRTLKAIPSSSFRTEQSRKRIARQVDSARKKTDELESEQQQQQHKKRNFEAEIKMLREEILEALTFL